MSQPQNYQQTQNEQSIVTRIGGTLRSLLWILALFALGSMLGYVAGLGISAILGYSAGGEFIVAQFLYQQGYVNASHAIQAQASNNLYQASTLPYVTTIVSGTVGAIVGYFKGKQEDKKCSV